MTEKIIIMGGGGVAREVHDVLEAINHSSLRTEGELRFDFLGFIAPEDSHSHLLASRGPLLGSDEALTSLPEGTRYVVGVGTGSIRKKLAALADAAGLRAATLIHPSAVVGSHGNAFGVGTVLCALSSITTDVSVGSHTFIDRNVTVGHDSKLNDYVSVYPSASISGSVTIGEGSTIGTGARIIQGLSIGSNAFVGAGAVVVQDVPPAVTVVGVPARQVS